MTTVNIPNWTNDLLKKYGAGVSHAFILHFNVNDQVVPGVSMRNWMTKIMQSRQVVVFYNRSEGITFAHPKMEETYRKLLGLEAQKADPALAALGSLGLGGSSSDEPELPRNPSQALAQLERLLQIDGEQFNKIMNTSIENPKTAAVIIEYAETIAPAADAATMGADDRTNLVTLQRWGRDAAIQGAANPIILTTANLSDINPAIRAASSKYEAIEVPLPDLDARQQFIAWQLDINPYYADLMSITAGQLANATAGLSLVHLEDIFLRADQEGALTLDLVKERKDSIINSEYEVIEIIDPSYGFEAIGGLEHVKKFFQNSVIRPISQGNYSRVPMGILMTGPAGTGKSAVAQAVAKEAGVNAVNLNLARILGSYVGQSERNLEKALRAIKSLSPTIVFIDEIDQSVSRSNGGDSGVGSRIFKRLLEFMSDGANRGKVVFLAATNRPDLMDAALRRPGRFDKKIPFLAPDAGERKSIFEVMARRYGLDCSEIDDSAVTATDGWTGAEIEAATVKAIELVYDEELSPCAALAEACKRLSPSTSDIEFMTNLAIQECNDRDLLPAYYRSMLDNRQELAAKVEQGQAQRRGKREM